MVSLLPNCKIMKRFKIFFIVLCSVLAAKAQSIVFNNQVPKHEVRAVWLTTIGGIDWPHSYAQSSYSAEKQKKELTDILDRLQQAKINTVLIQTRVRGTMIYPSAYEPWDGCLSGFPGRSPGYDALQFAIDECHKRSMELHGVSNDVCNLVVPAVIHSLHRVQYASLYRFQAILDIRDGSLKNYV